LGGYQARGGEKNRSRVAGDENTGQNIKNAVLGAMEVLGKRDGAKEKTKVSVQGGVWIKRNDAYSSKQWVTLQKSRGPGGGMRPVLGLWGKPKQGLRRDADVTVPVAMKNWIPPP